MDAHTKCVWIVTVLVVMTIHHVRGFDLTIVHTNGFHSTIEEENEMQEQCTKAQSNYGECYGGIRRLKAKIDELRAKYPNSYYTLLDAGDQFSHSLYYTANGGEMVATFMNALKYDAMSLCTHEFHDGPEGLEPFVNLAQFDIVSSNANFSKTPKLSKIKKSAAVLVRQKKIGVIGYIRTKTARWSNAGAVTFTDEVEAIQKEVDKLTKQGINKIIGLGCASFKRHLEIAKEVKGLDIIVAGAGRKFLYEGKPPSNDIPDGPYPTVVETEDGDKVLVVTTPGYGKYLGFLQVLFDNDGKVEAWNGNPVLLGSKVLQDPSLDKIIEGYATGVHEIRSNIVGMSMVYLDANISVCGFQECNIGNMVTDMMIRHYMTKATPWRRTNIAMFNAGGIRHSLKRGNVTHADVLAMLPFTNTYDLTNLTGQTIWEALEHSASKYGPKDKGRSFLQLSGLQVVYDMRKKVGHRVSTVHAQCTDCPMLKFERLNMTKIYSVVLSSYLIFGGDGYTMFTNDNGSSHVKGSLDTDVLVEYFKKYSPISFGVDDRIRFMKDLENDHLCTASGGISISPIFFMLITNVVFSIIYSQTNALALLNP